MSLTLGTPPLEGKQQMRQEEPVRCLGVSSSPRKIGLKVQEIYASYFAGQDLQPCVPDGSAAPVANGFCTSTDQLDAACRAPNNEIRSSVDCAAFEGSWCCYEIGVVNR